jgi:hypothetical protein
MKGIKELTAEEARRMGEFNRMFAVRCCAYGVLAVTERIDPPLGLSHAGEIYCVRPAKHQGDHWVIPNKDAWEIYWKVMNGS